jgi:hypothetical protein
MIPSRINIKKKFDDCMQKLRAKFIDAYSGVAYRLKVLIYELF